MRAAVYHGPLDLRIEERPDPVPGPTDVLLRVSVTGVCGTDAAEYHTGPHLYWTGDAHPASGHRGPVVPGHEVAGRVAAVGGEVDGLREGDLVVTGAGVSCGACRACRRGATNLCEHYWTVGLQRDGGLAEFVAVPASSCLVVEPDSGLPEDAAGLAQPMAIAAHAVARGEPTPDDDILVIGIGGIGGFVTFAASRIGARVVACEVDPGRRALAVGFGAADGIGPDALVDAAPSADIVYEVSGTPAGLSAALGAVRPGGRVVVVGMQEPPSAVDLRRLALREVALVGTVAHRSAIDLPAALGLLAARPEGWADVAPTAIPLERVVDDGLVPLWDRTSPRLKTLVDPRITAARPTVVRVAPSSATP